MATEIYDYNHVEPTEEDPLRQNEQVEEKQDTCCTKILVFFKNITLEPSLFLFIVAIMINSTASTNLNLEKACRVNLNFNDTICNSLRAQDLHAENQFERETQNLLADALIWKTYISATIPSVIAILAGAFSDTTGHRKFFIIISMIGQLLSGVNSIINVYYMYQLNLEVLVLSGAAIEGLTGGWTLCFLTAFTYISNISTEENRTFRMGLLSVSVTVAFPIGAAVSGVLLRYIDYYGCFGLACSLNFVNVLYVLIVVRDPKRTQEQKKHDRQGCCHLVRQYFNVANIKDSVKVFLKKAPNNRRLRLCLLLAVIGVLFGPLYGELAVMYMLTRYRFGWDEVQYGWFQAYNAVMQIFGMLLSLMLFSKYLGWHDSMLGILSILSKIAAAFVYCFAPNAKIFYIAPFVELLNGSSQLAIRSIISKLVDPLELGKVNSIAGLVENLMPLIYVPMYTKIYTATIEVLPGAVFLVGAGLTLPAMAVLIWLFYDHRKQLRQSKTSHPD